MDRTTRKKLLDKVNYLHGYLEDGRRCTAAFTFDNETEELHVALSVCAFEDNFSRTAGRFNSVERLSRYFRKETFDLVTTIKTTSMLEYEVLKDVRKDKNAFLSTVYYDLA